MYTIVVEVLGVERDFFVCQLFFKEEEWRHTHTHTGDFEVDGASICTDIQTFSFPSLVCDLSYPNVSHSPSFHPLRPPLITNAVSNAFKHSHYFGLVSSLLEEKLKGTSGWWFSPVLPVGTLARM